jgi:AraC-like DNA-binding protein
VTRVEWADPAIIRFSTHGFPEEVGFHVWRDTFALKVTHVDVETPDPVRFRADIRVRPMGSGLILSENQLGECTMMRTPELLRDGDDSLALVICRAGQFDSYSCDDRAMLTPGLATLLPHHRLGGARISEGTQTFVLRLERDMARELLPSLDKTVTRPTRPGDPAIAILSAYCEQLMISPTRIPAATVEIANTQILELTAHILANRDGAEIAGSDSMRAARFKAIKEHIAANLDQQDLSIAIVAARHQLTARQLQRLFEAEDVTFTKFVLEQRLARAHRMLADPRYAGMKVSAVAFDAGFGDLSYFNRSFRARYDVAPSDVRARALRELQDSRLIN